VRKPLTAFTHAVPHRRNKRGEAVPGCLVADRPLVTLDPEELVRTAEACFESPEEALRRRPLLLARNALAAQDKVLAQREAMLEAREATNARYEAQLAALRPLLDAARQDVTESAVKLCAGLAEIGVQFRPGQPSLTVEDGDLPSLEEIAGAHGLDAPSDGPRPLTKFFVNVAGIVGTGLAVGVGLGLLTGQVELYDLAGSAPGLAVFAAVGTTVMALVHAALSPLALFYGERLGQAGLKSADVRRRTAVVAGLLLLLLAATFVLTDAKVEQAGLLRAVVESESLATTRLGAVEAWLVSLIVALPAVASFVLQGTSEGMRRTNMCRLRHLQRLERRKIEEGPSFAACCAEYQRYVRNEALATVLEGKASQIEALVQWEDSEYDRQRMQDTEADAAVHSYATERALFGHERATPAGWLRRFRQQWGPT
jgi:hypothetical protein